MGQTNYILFVASSFYIMTYLGENIKSIKHHFMINVFNVLTIVNFIIESFWNHNVLTSKLAWISRHN